MSDLHFVGASSPDGQSLEAVDPKFVRDGLLRAREKSWEGLRKIHARLKEGMTEGDARKLANETLAELGSTKYWHQPYVRFGPGTALTFHNSLQKDYRLKEGDPIYLDLGPVWHDPESGLDYEGDVGDAFVLGTNPEVEKCIQVAHELWEEAKTLWQKDNLSGDKLYSFLDKRASELGYILHDKVNGHRLGDYPHTKYSKERLSKVPFRPGVSLWILEFQLNAPDSSFGVFFEDLLQ